jgi:hypothetical protein
MNIYYSYKISHFNTFNEYTKEQQKGEEAYQCTFLHTIDIANELEEKLFRNIILKNLRVTIGTNEIIEKYSFTKHFC